MSSKIILKKSSVTSKVPQVADLDYGELALNYADGKLYYKKSDGTIDYFKTFTTVGNFSSQTTSGLSTFSGEVLLDNAGGAGSTEGGELHFAIPTANTSLNGPIAIDIYGNKLRIFETTGTNRGVYIDLSTASGGVGTNLLASSGTVTSVGLSVPTGLSVSGSPVTTSGTLAISLAAGYSIPTTASQTNWDTAYTDRLKWDGGSTGLVAATARTSLGLVIGTNVQAWDADLDAIAALAGTSGVLKKTAANTWALDTTILPATSFEMNLTGDASGFASANIYGATTLTVTLANSGVTAGTYKSVTVDAKGRVTGGTNPTTISGYGITDAYTKTEVDSLLQGLDPKASVVAATTTAITLAGTQTIDGVAVVVGDRVLVKNQGTPAQNGIYVVSSTSWTRATDMNLWSEVPAAYVLVEKGTTLKDTGWVCTSDAGGTLDTTAITWVQFIGAGTVTAGTGIAVSGNQVSLSPDVTVIGTYRSVTVDTYGRVTSGTNPTTLSGYGITDAQPLDADLTAIAALTGTSGFLKTNGAGTWTVDTSTYLTTTSAASTYSPLAGSSSITTLGTIATGTWQGSVINSTYGGTGVNNGGRTLTINTNSGTLTFTTAATTLTVANTASVSGINTGDQTITLTGDVTGSGTGSFAATLANSGVTAGTYKSVTVDAKGRVTGGTNPTTISGYGITDAYTKTEVDAIPAVQDSKIQTLGSVSGTQTINLANGRAVVATITGATTWAFTGLTSGQVNSVALLLTNPGVGTQTFPTGTVFDKNTAPVLPTSGKTLIILETYDGGTSWIAAQGWRNVA